MEIPVSGENHYVSNLVFSLCMLECLDKLQNREMSLLHSSTSQHLWVRQPSPVGRSYHFLLQPSGGQYLHQISSLSPVVTQHHTNTNTARFDAE